MFKKLLLALIIPSIAVAMDTPITAGGSTVPSLTVTNYSSISGNLLNWDTVEGNVRNINSADSCTIKSFFCSVGTAPGVGKSWSFTLVDNAVDTALVCTIADANTTGSDLSDTVTSGAGRTYSYKSVPSGTPTAPVTVGFSILFSCGANVSPIFGGTRATTMATGATEYHSIMENAAGGATLANKDQVIPTGGALSKMYVELTGTPGGTATYAFTLLKNDITQTMLCTVLSGATTCSDLANPAISFTAGDLVALQDTPALTPTARIAHYSFLWTPTIDGESLLLGASGSAMNTAGATRFLGWTGTSMSWTATEASTQSLVNAAILKNFYVNLITAPGGAASYTLRSRIGAANGNVLVTITGANTTGSDTSNSDTLSDGNKINVSSLSASTPASSIPRWGAVLYIAPATTSTNHFLSVMGAGS